MFLRDTGLSFFLKCPCLVLISGCAGPTKLVWKRFPFCVWEEFEKGGINVASVGWNSPGKLPATSGHGAEKGVCDGLRWAVSDRM